MVLRGWGRLMFPLSTKLGATVTGGETAAQRAAGWESRSPIRDWACTTCGYGVSVREVPPRCPMCGEQVWLPARVHTRGMQM